MSDPTRTLAVALAAAQGELRDPSKTKKAKIRGNSEYAYAGLDDVLSAVRGVLSKHGIAFTQATEILDSGAVILATRVWVDGPDGRDEIVSRWPLDVSGSHHDQGSALTYARRYGISLVLGVASSDDDDGHQAVANHQSQRASRATPARAPQRSNAPANNGPPPRSIAQWKQGITEAGLDPWFVGWFHSKRDESITNMGDTERGRSLVWAQGAGRADLDTEAQRQRTTMIERWKELEKALEEGLRTDLEDSDTRAAVINRMYGATKLEKAPLRELIDGPCGRSFLLTVNGDRFEQVIVEQLDALYPPGTP